LRETATNLDYGLCAKGLRPICFVIKHPPKREQKERSNINLHSYYENDSGRIYDGPKHK
jgi:hypothetical protein